MARSAPIGVLGMDALIARLRATAGPLAARHLARLEAQRAAWMKRYHPDLKKEQR